MTWETISHSEEPPGVSLNGCVAKLPTKYAYCHRFVLLSRFSEKLLFAMGSVVNAETPKWSEY